MMITKYADFINEKHEPLEGKCGVTIGDKELTFTVKDIIKYAEDNYKYERISVEDIYDLGLFNEQGKGEGEATFLVDGEWQTEDEISPEEKSKFDKEQKDIIEAADLKYPIIVASKGDKITAIIDGNHRLEKANNRGNKTIKAYVLPEEDLLKDWPENIKNKKK